MASHTEEITYDRFLPASLETSLMGAAARIGGAAILFLLAVAWVSLITWSSADPSFTNTTSHKIENFLGAPGATLADVLLQAFGVASVLVLLSPMFWGLELLATQRFESSRSKILYYVLAVLLMAGALSALPGFPAWHFQQGLGGAFGDIVYSLGAGIGGIFLPKSGGAIAGFVFFGLGFAAIAHSLGLQVRDMFQAFSKRGEQLRLHQTGITQRGVGSPQLPVSRDGHGSQPDTESGTVDHPRPVSREWGPYDPGFNNSYDLIDDDPNDGALEDEEVDLVREPQLDSESSKTWCDDAFDHEGAQEFGPNVHDDGEWEGAYLEDGEEFDRHTDDASQVMAQRFAPAKKGSTKIGAVSRKIEQSLSSVAFLGGSKGQKSKARFRLPSLNLLQRSSKAKPSVDLSQSNLRQTAEMLKGVLADFGVRGEVGEIRPGPVVTVFEFEPARGTKASRVIGLADDVARNMSATSARAAVVPGQSAIGIELPNVRREPVVLRDVLASNAFRNFGGTLPLALGKSISGEPVVSDLATMPHLLVAGTTGAGKSVAINAMIASLIYKNLPEDCRLLLIDPKMLELSVYNGIPHLLSQVVTDPEHAVNALNWVVCEMEERYKRMSKLAVRNIQVFNNRVKNAKKLGQAISRTVQTGFDGWTGEAVFEEQTMDLSPMPYIVVVIDEFSDLMVAAGKEVEHAVLRLAQMARAAGIHLIMATQRPSVDVITGTIKANLPSRIGFRVASKVDSRTILNDSGAEQLLGQGDMLLSTGSDQLRRVHGAFVADEEIELIASALREQGGPQYVDGITNFSFSEQKPAEQTGDNDRDLYQSALELVLCEKRASVSFLQRRLSVGYNRAADLMDQLEEGGIVSAPSRNGRREVIASAGSLNPAG